MKDLLKALVFGGIFLVPFLPIYVENDFFFPFITGKNFAFRILVEIIFAAWALLALMDAKYRPRFSWLLAGFASLIVVMFFANLFGEYPLKSFWSNFERMDGYVTLVHLFMLVVVMGSVMTSEKLWTYFFYTSSAVALYVALYGLAQMQGIVEGGRGRLDSRLGNAAYMAVYMLFHMFFVAWLAVRSKNWVVWAGGSLTIVLFGYALLLTATRGTTIGFIGGACVTVAYVALFGRKYPEIRKYAVAGVIGLTILILSFIAVRDSAFIQENNALARIANIDIATDLETRGVIWSMALEGVKQRPILGWGQGNFNYVFNQEFEPELYAKEAWFDRVHNIVLDWLIAGGVLGFAAYVSIFIAFAYYLFYLPFFKNDERLDILERAVIIGLLAGYILHNLVVFDNIISYIFFACLIALVHFRVAEKIDAVENVQLEERLVTQIIAPIVVVLAGATIYFVNAPGIQAAGDIIDAMRETSVRARLEHFHQALERNSFADQEIVEQLAQQAMNVARTPNLPQEEAQLIIQRAELELLRMTDEKPGDARLHNFLATFYRTIGAYENARQQGALARNFSPRKQAIILEQGVTELQLGEVEKARDFFKEAYELDTSNTQALRLYAATEARLGNSEKVRELLGDTHMEMFAQDDFVINSVNEGGDMELLAELFESRVELAPQDPQNWASLSYVYYQMDELEKAINTLERAASSAPAFADRAQCFIGNMRTGNDPALGCDQVRTTAE